MSTAQHKQQAGQIACVCGVLTVSDTRTVETDGGGQRIQQLLRDAGHSIGAYAIVRDEPVQIEHALGEWLARTELQVIITTGGTGIARRDTTIEVVQRLIEKPLDGFGELFRMLSYQQVGSAAMLSRATAGLSGETLLFALPGSLDAVGLALEQLILPELPHLVWERRR